MKRTGNPNQGTIVKIAASPAFNIGDWDSYSDESGLPESAAKHESLIDPHVRTYRADLPHFKQINRIPSIDVARKIGWEVAVEKSGEEIVEKIVCPRSTEHKPGTSPYLRVLQSNNRVVCESCDTYPMTVLEMVQHFKGFDTLHQAAEYVACSYPDVPRKAKASYLNNPTGEHVPPGCLDPWILLISSGIYSRLAVPSQRLIPVLLERAKWRDDGGEYRLHFSQRAMMRYTGIASFTGISEGLTELAAIGFLQRLPVPRRKGSVEREVAEYVLTPLSQRLREFADETAAKLGATIHQEKAIARRKRQGRERKRLSPLSD
jgi:hypothetical protein